MKKLILLFSVVAAAAMTGFYAQGRPDAGAISAAGDRQMYRVTRFEGQPITGVSASVGFRVEVNESARTSVRVEIPAEWQDRLICEISPEGVVRLGIDTEGLRNFRGHDLTAVVNLGKVDVMKASTGAKITCNGSFTGGNAKISASTGGMVSGLTLTASGVGIKVSTGASVKDLHIVAGQVTAEGSTGASLSGAVFDASALSCKAGTGASLSMSHTGQSAALASNTGGSIRISGSAGSLTVNKSRTGGRVDTGNYKVDK